MTLGFGSITSVSTEQKANARSSTEAEMNAGDDIISKVLWSKLFIKAQGFDVKACTATCACAHMPMASQHAQSVRLSYS